MTKLVLALILASASVVVQADTTSNLGQCIADSTTGKDRKILVRWVLASMVQHPAMSDLSTVSDTQFEEINKSTALVMERLITLDCKTDFQVAYKAGGERAVGAGFEYLGRVAMQELIADPKVSAAMASLTKYGDAKKIRQAISE